MNMLEEDSKITQDFILFLDKDGIKHVTKYKSLKATELIKEEINNMDKKETIPNIIKILVDKKLIKIIEEISSKFIVVKV